MKTPALSILAGFVSLTGVALGHVAATAVQPVAKPMPTTISTIAPITVHFPRMPISGYNFTYTYNVPRTTFNPQKDVAALQALFAGPTAAEVASAPGLQTPLPLLSANACNGQPLPAGTVNAGRFMLRRTVVGPNVAYKIRFCQTFTSGGIGNDARLQSNITQTLWANLNALPGVNNISQIEIALSNNSCIGGSGNICWP
jgi:hypothetical protein